MCSASPGGPLTGRLIAVTRPAAQAESLCAGIRRAGGVPLRFPVLAIGPTEDSAQLDAAIAGLDGFDLAFFVSPNAVQYTLRAVLARRAWPAKVAVATVGKGSERTLAEFGFTHVIAPAEGFDSEAVLALPEFSADAVRGRRVVIFRGDGGRDLLGETLTARGAQVVYVTTYRRFVPAADPKPVLDPARAGTLDALLLTSSEGARNLAAMVGEEGMALLGQVPVFVPHTRIAAFAREAGFRVVIETGPGDEGLLQALSDRFGQCGG